MVGKSCSYEIWIHFKNNNLKSMITTSHVSVLYYDKMYVLKYHNHYN